MFRCHGVYLKSPGWQPIVAQKVPYSWQKKEISSHICAFAHTPTLPCIWALTSRFFSSKAWVVDVPAWWRPAHGLKSGNCSHIRPAGDHQAGGGMSEAVDVQVQGQAVLLQNQFEPPGEGTWGHGQVGAVTAEDVVLWGEGMALVKFQLPLGRKSGILSAGWPSPGKSRHTGPLRWSWVLSR